MQKEKENFLDSIVSNSLAEESAINGFTRGDKRRRVLNSLEQQNQEESLMWQNIKQEDIEHMV